MERTMEEGHGEDHGEDHVRRTMDRSMDRSMERTIEEHVRTMATTMEDHLAQGLCEEDHGGVFFETRETYRLLSEPYCQARVEPVATPLARALLGIFLNKYREMSGILVFE
jgi:hypothetical protein